MVSDIVGEISIERYDGEQNYLSSICQLGNAKSSFWMTNLKQRCDLNPRKVLAFVKVIQGC